MFPVNPTQTQSRFLNLVMKRKDNQNAKNKFDNYEDQYKELLEQLKNIRKGAKPITGKNSFSQDNVGVLNDNDASDKKHRYGEQCPECQDIYKRSSSKYNELVPYRHPDNQIEIIS